MNGTERLTDRRLRPRQKPARSLTRQTSARSPRLLAALLLVTVLVNVSARLICAETPPAEVKFSTASLSSQASPPPETGEVSDPPETGEVSDPPETGEVSDPPNLGEVSETAGEEDERFEELPPVEEGKLTEKGKKERVTRVDKAIRKIEALCAEIPEDKRHYWEELSLSAGGPIRTLKSSGKVGRQKIFKALRDKKKDWRVHVVLVEALAGSKDESVLPELERVLLSDEYHEQVRGQVPHALEAYYKPEKIRKILERALRKKNLPKEVKRDVISIVSIVGIDDLDLLMALLDSPVDGINDMGMIFRSIDAIGLSTRATATDVLIDLMLNRYPNGSLARSVIAEALGRRKDKKAVQALIAVMRTDSEGVNKTWSITALGEIGSPEAVDDLIKMLGDQDEVVCWRAAEALGKIGDKRALPHIKKLIDNLSTDDRFESRLKSSGGDMTIPGIRKAYEVLSR